MVPSLQQALLAMTYMILAAQTNMMHDMTAALMLRVCLVVMMVFCA